jgi:hypothetical protein
MLLDCFLDDCALFLMVKTEPRPPVVPFFAVSWRRRGLRLQNELSSCLPALNILRRAHNVT